MIYRLEPSADQLTWWMVHWLTGELTPADFK